MHNGLSALRRFTLVLIALACAPLCTTPAHAVEISGPGWSLDTGDDWKLTESHTNATSGRSWVFENKDNHTITLTETPVSTTTPAQAAAQAFRAFEESEDDASIDEEKPFPGGHWIRMSGGPAMNQSRQASWWFTLPQSRQLNATWQGQLGSPDDAEIALLSRLRIDGKSVALTNPDDSPSPAVAVAAPPAPAAITPTPPASAASTNAPAKTTADLFAEFDAAYAAAPDIETRARAAGAYLKALHAAKDPHEKTEVLECVRRFRVTEGPAGLFQLSLRAPSPHLATIQGALDPLERGMIKSLARDSVEKAARQQQASLAATAHLTPAESLAQLLRPRPEKPAADGDAAPVKPEPPDYDLDALRRRAFTGDRLAIFDLSLHYGGIHDDAFFHPQAFTYWKERGFVAGWEKTYAQFAGSSEETYRALLKSISEQGSIVAASTLRDELSAGFVSVSSTLTFTAPDGTQFTATQRSLGRSHSVSYSDYRQVSKQLDTMAVFEQPSEDRGGTVYINGRADGVLPGGLFSPDFVFGPLGKRHAYQSRRFLVGDARPPVDWGSILVLDGKIAAELPAGSSRYLDSIGFSPDETHFAHLEIGQGVARLLIDLREYASAARISTTFAWLGNEPVYATTDANGRHALHIGLRKHLDLPGQLGELEVFKDQILFSTLPTENDGRYIFHNQTRHGPYTDVYRIGFSPAGKNVWWFAATEKKTPPDYQLFINGRPTKGTVNILSPAAPVFDREENHWMAIGGRPSLYTLLRDDEVIYRSASTLDHPAISADGKRWGVAPRMSPNSHVVIDGEIVADYPRQPGLNPDRIFEGEIMSPKFFWTPDSKPAWFASDRQGWQLVVDGVAGPRFAYIDQHTLGFYEDLPFYLAEITKDRWLVIGGYNLSLPGKPRRLARSGDRLRVLLETYPDNQEPARDSYGLQAVPSVISLLEIDLAQFKPAKSAAPAAPTTPPSTPTRAR